MDKQSNLVSMYEITAIKRPDIKLVIRVLAINSNWALTFVNRDVDFDYISVDKLTDVVGLADYGARCINNEDYNTYINYHCKPINP